jgi:hypothetical protein
VGHTSPSKYVIARMRAEGLTTNLKRVFALKNEPRLILSLVNVQANPLAVRFQ